MDKKQARMIVESLPSLYPMMRDVEEEAIWEILAENIINVPANEDCISRQAAIDALRTCYDTETVTMDNGDEYINYEDAVGEIEQLPSAQPKQRTGKWIKKHRHYGGFRSYTGFDAMGEQHTVTVDERTEYDDLYCSECGARSADNFLNFCPNCGAKMVG